MIRQLLHIETYSFHNGHLTYALWSDGILEKLVVKNSRVVFYEEIEVRITT